MLARRWSWGNRIDGTERHNPVLSREYGGAERNVTNAVGGYQSSRSYRYLNDPVYQDAYADDLKKMLPHIPTPESRERFEQLASAGRNLSDLHVDYEMVDPYRLDVPLRPSTSLTTDMAGVEDEVGKKKDSETGKNVDDRTALVHNPKATIVGIPEEAERYLPGSWSALAWIFDRYRVKIDKATSTIPTIGATSTMTLRTLSS